MTSNNYGRNGYNYSPYYQQQGQQPVNTNTPAQSEQTNINLPYYRSLQDVPVQAPPAGPLQYSSGQPQSGGYAGSYGDQTYGTSSNTTRSGGEAARGGAQASPNYSNDTNARSYVDTSALGSLAYASALGRNSPAMEKSTNAQRPGSPRGGLVSPYGASGNVTSGYPQPRSDSRGSTSAGGSKAQSNPISSYAASIAANALAQAQKSASRASPQLQYSADQASSQNNQNTAQNYGNSNRADDSTYATGSQASASNGCSKSANPPSSSERPAHEYPTTTQNPSTPQHRPRISGGHSGYTGSSYGSGVAHPHGLPPLQNTNSHSNSTVTLDQSRQSGQYHGNQGHQTNAARSTQPAQAAPAQVNSNNTTLSYGRPDLQVINQESNAQANVEHPATVDPSQVFNMQEYQRRKVEADAEAAKKAAEQRKAQGQKPTSSAAAMTTNNQPGPPAKQASADSGSKEQIEAEMKAMIEKMREYKAKDPALFSEVWEQFKKVRSHICSSIRK